VRERRPAGSPAPKVSPDVRQLQLRFLSVFWLYKMADWLQGPYFVEVYSSKVLNGVAMSTQGVANLFLAGFASTAIFGAVVGGLVDSTGRKLGSLVFSVMYAISALSTRCATLPRLLAGRVAGGIGTSLLFSAPEAWLVTEHERSGFDSKYLGQTFGLAYFGDAIVAIAAGQLASAVASGRGPTAPFEISVVFLAAGALIALLSWRENTGRTALGKEPKPTGEASTEATEEGGAFAGALSAMAADKRIMLVGAVQALFEGAMYIFVLQWPMACKRALAGLAVPFGKVFSCFMVCCMIGSTSFGALSQRFAAEDIMGGMLLLAALAMGGATLGAATTTLAPLIASFFAFEFCVGMYFPLIGTLRSKYLPDAYRGLIMNLFGIPLNLIVVAVFLSIEKLGLAGALSVSTVALVGALTSQLLLRLSLQR